MIQWRHKPKTRGFSLLELSIVLVILGLLAGAGMTMGANAIASANSVKTRERLETLKEALESYAKTNGYLPCPANRALVPSNSNFGKEVRACAASGAGLVSVNAGEVFIGAVPVRSLGLPDAYAADAWGNKITYAVCTDQTVDYTQSSGCITVNTGDRTGVNYAITSTTDRTTTPSTIDQITPGEGASFVIVSHGADARGAFPQLGTGVNKACGSGNQNDVENCDDGNGIFWDTSFADGDVEAKYFDDFIVWGSNALDMPPIDVSATSCASGCEVSCAPCTTSMPSITPTAPTGLTNPVLCSKIITSSSPCQAACLWAGTETSTGEMIRCP